MRWPWISVRVADELERQLSYRDDLIDRIRKERDELFDRYSRAMDSAAMSVGQPPVGPLLQEQKVNYEEERKRAEGVVQLFASVDAENRFIEEELSN